MDQSLLIRDCTLWTDAGLRKGSILIENGRISRVARRVTLTTVHQIHASGLLALPGPIDVHVHLRGMGLQRKEDFTTGTSAAAAGGFTTVLDMPNTLPPTDSPARLAEKMRHASKQALVNIGFHAAAVPDVQSIDRMAEMGAFSLKLYLPKPISPFKVESDNELRMLMRNAHRANIPLTVHAEEPTALMSTSHARDFYDLAKTRPYDAETRAVSRILRLHKKVKSQVHFCHISLSESLKGVRSSHGTTCEVTPHHMLLSRQLLKRIRWKAWMVPPLRSEAQRRKLLHAVVNGLAEMIATDHAPHLAREKSVQPDQSPPGVPGLETALPLLMSLVNKGTITLRTLVNCLARNPARVFGLQTKGKIAEGYDGDMVLVDMKQRGVIRPENFFSKAKYSPFEGSRTKGQVRATIVAGRIVYENGQLMARPGTGMVLKRVR